ncbi:hypothetical protein ACFE04_022906 [Oxalis oulophora]
MASQEEQVEGSLVVQPETMTEMCAFANDQTPKVRKPYTISKQREKWTDQEHRRFLEALKLYGRGWRQIEEHIGTKTAVQIRSHAQKFFSKVVRESSNSAESPIKPVEIPPPRPKRKPMHPYPRKSVDTLRVASNPNHTERSPSPNLLTAAEKNNGSPTSAFSAVASEMFESVFSEQHNGCSSPTSCFTDVQSVNLSPIEKENDNDEEKIISMPAVQLCLSSTVENLQPTDAGLKESGFTTGDETVSLLSIKLFGQTVSVTDSNISVGNSDVEDEKVTVQIESDRQISLGMFASDYKENPTSIETVGNPLPWWTAYQGMPFFYPMPCNQLSGRATASEFEMRGDNSEAVDYRQSSLNNKAVTDKCTKGFVPYKRCLAQRENKSSVESSERDRQRARVYL